MKHAYSSILLSVVFFSAVAQTATTISVDASRIEGHISPWLYGSCIEDVNHEIYGGVYAQRIFGESFEEPDATYGLGAYSRYEGVWFAYGDTLAISASRGGKLLYEGTEVGDGTMEVEMRMDNDRGNMTGVIFRVSEEGIGLDNFCGYSVAFANVGSRIVVGKHRHNFQTIGEMTLRYDANDWNRVKVVMKGNSFELFLNGKSFFKYTDDDRPFLTGKVGMRNQVTDTWYRNFTVDAGDGKPIAVTNRTAGARAVSCMWDPVVTPDTRAIFIHDREGAFNGRYSQCISLNGKGTAGIANMGLNRWGIAVDKGERLRGSLWLKGTGAEVRVALRSADGDKEYASQRITGITGEWARYDFVLTAAEMDPKAAFAVLMDAPGKVWVDQITLMPGEEKLYNGLPLRADIVRAMKAQGLTMLRYGGTMVNVPGYRFRNMIGERDRRPPYRGHWYAYSTNGFGIEEFLQLCEAGGFVPSFAVSIDENPQEMADMVEYLNGHATSKWGAVRAANGHPEPYGIKYIEIGNEEVIRNSREEAYRNYIERFELLAQAMKNVDPSLSLIIAVEWKPQLREWMEIVFRALDGKADYWDYHPWADPLEIGWTVDTSLTQMKQMFTEWNPRTTMKCAIFEENGNTHNLQRALAHATLQNAARRHGDFVLATCAANALQPWLQNDNSWNQGQIFFTPSQVWGMPPYYAQQMAADNHQPLRVTCSLGGDLDVVAARSESADALTLYVCNITAHAVHADIRLDGMKKVTRAKAITLTGKLHDVNTPSEPERIIPVERAVTLDRNSGADHQHEFPPYSYTILVYSKN